MIGRGVVSPLSGNGLVVKRGLPFTSIHSSPTFGVYSFTCWDTPGLHVEGVSGWVGLVLAVVVVFPSVSGVRRSAASD